MDVNSINAELQILAAEANEAIIDSIYEDMLMDQLAAMTAAYTMADDDCDGPWYWELK
jgi:hypothetical protein